MSRGPEPGLQAPEDAGRHEAAEGRDQEPLNGPGMREVQRCREGEDRDRESRDPCRRRVIHDGGPDVLPPSHDVPGHGFQAAIPAA